MGSVRKPANLSDGSMKVRAFEQKEKVIKDNEERMNGGNMSLLQSWFPSMSAQLESTECAAREHCV